MARLKVYGYMLIGALLMMMTAGVVASPWANLVNPWNAQEANTITILDPIEFTATGAAQTIPIGPTSKKLEFVSRETTADWFFNINGVDAQANGDHSVRLTAGASYFCNPCLTDTLSVIDDGSATTFLQVIVYH